MSKVFLSFAVFVIAAAVSCGQSLIQGTVLGAGDVPLRAAHVSLLYPNDPAPVRIVKADSTGHFALDIPETGIWIVQWTGVGYSEYHTALFFEKPETVTVRIVLGAQYFEPVFQNPRIVGDFNRFYPLSAVPLKMQSDSTYVAEVSTTADTVAYRILGVRLSLPCEGTQADHYLYDPSEGYTAVMKTNNGKARITFDPRLLCRSPRSATTEFLSGSNIARFSRVFDEFQAHQDSARWGMHLYLRANKPRGKYAYDWASVLPQLQNELQSEKDPLVREELAVNILSTLMLAKSTQQADYASVLRELRPSSIAWALIPRSLVFSLIRSGLSEEAVEQYVDAFVVANRNERIKPSVLQDAFMVARLADNKTRSNKYYDLLAEKYADTPDGGLILDKYSRFSDFKEGSTVPAFSASSLSDSTVTFTEQSFKGKYLLVSFWKSSDSVSRDRFADLRAAFRKYGKSKLAILGVALDGSRQTVINFIQTQPTMPWAQAFLKRGMKNRMANDFLVTSVPSLFLIDPAGKCVALGEHLNAKTFFPTLQKYLGKPSHVE